MSTAFCDTISLNTDAISIDIIIMRWETVRRHRRSVCQSAISLPQALQASQQSLMGHHGIKIFDNLKKIDFKQTTIDFQEKNDFNIPKNVCAYCMCSLHDTAYRALTLTCSSSEASSNNFTSIGSSLASSTAFWQ